MSPVGVTRQYEDLNSKLSSIPMGGKLGFISTGTSPTKASRDFFH
jgi:hypothetical protein